MSKLIFLLILFVFVLILSATPLFRKSRSQRQDGTTHVRADEGVAGGHQHLGFTGIDHLGHELGGGEIGHFFFL